MLDAALAGDAPTALAQLERLLWAGEVPIALLGQIAASLRRLAAATRLVEQRGSNKRSMSLGRALEESGVKPYFIQKTEEQLRRLGRARGAQLYGWLLQADLALKGTSSSPARSRLVLETLIVRLAAPQSSVPVAAKPVAAVRAR
jgi:DNA polymerase-3 subunit delta